MGIDPYHGAITTPISLHDYLYAHNNPVLGRDPSGLSNMLELNIGVSETNKGQARNSVHAFENAKSALRSVCKSVDTIVGNARHHIIPFFMRGGGVKSFADKTELFGMVKSVHDSFHSLLDITLKMRGFVGRSGNKGAGGATSYYTALATAKDLSGVFNALVEAAEVFDDVCSAVSGNFKMKNEVANMKHLMGL